MCLRIHLTSSPVNSKILCRTLILCNGVSFNDPKEGSIRPLAIPSFVYSLLIKLFGRNFELVFD